MSVTELQLWQRVAAKATLLLVQQNYPHLNDTQREQKATELLVGFVDVERDL